MDVTARMIFVNVRKILVSVFVRCHSRGNVFRGSHGFPNIVGALQISKVKLPCKS
jgi:hypothetical protein